MDKSIESIWKEGFLKDSTLKVPKINDLYNQKSIHLLDQFKNRYKWNFKFLVIFSFIVLILSFPIGMKYMGIPIFFIFNGLVIFSKKHLDSMQDIDNSKNSYDCLKSYKNWLEGRISMMSKVYRFVYPLIFLSVAVGFWFLDLGEKGFLGTNINEWLMQEFPATIFVGGVPLLGLLAVLLTLGGFAFFGERLYHSDFRAVYGKLMDRLEELIVDMESLRG